MSNRSESSLLPTSAEAGRTETRVHAILYLGKQKVTRERVAQVIGTVHPTQAVAAERAYIAAFFDLHLRGRARNLLKQPSPNYPEIQFLGR